MEVGSLPAQQATHQSGLLVLAMFCYILDQAKLVHSLVRRGFGHHPPRNLGLCKKNMIPVFLKYPIQAQPSKPRVMGISASIIGIGKSMPLYTPYRTLHNPLMSTLYFEHIRGLGRLGPDTTVEIYLHLDSWG